MNAAISQRFPRTTVRQRGFAVGRLTFWILLGIWGLLAWFIAEPISNNLRVRINDLDQVPGGGLIMRDPGGTFYHVNAAGRARAVYPKLAQPIYEQVCLDCAMINGDQLSQTSEFCISGIRNTLPALEFEIPCRTWTPMGESHKVLTFAVFIAPILAFWLFRALIQRAAAKGKKR